MKRRKFISAVPAAILLGQRPSAAVVRTTKEGVMLMTLIGPQPSEPDAVSAGSTDKRVLTGSLWEDAMPLYVPERRTDLREALVR